MARRPIWISEHAIPQDGCPILRHAHLGLWIREVSLPSIVRRNAITRGWASWDNEQDCRNCNLETMRWQKGTLAALVGSREAEARIEHNWRPNV